MKRILAINPPVLCVNECQREWYSFAHPTSLLKIVAFHKSIGNRVDFIDCMEYEDEWHKPLSFYKKLPIGTNGLGLTIDTFILGRPHDWLKHRLADTERPDEVWISCHITFNAALAHKTIALVREVFGEVPVVFGGNYPTLFYEEAAKSGATVFRGRLKEAVTLFPDYTVFETPPSYFVFQLTLGCKNACTHCVNHKLGPIVKFDIEAVVNDIKEKRRSSQIRAFVNIDPNVACHDLAGFLKAVIAKKLDVDLYFFGGIQPDYVTKQLASLMRQANVKGISLPRELSKQMNIRLHKKYTDDDFYQAIRLFEKEGYDLSAFHCPFPVGLKDDDMAHLLAIIQEIKALRAVPEIAPISFIPDTPEYENHFDLLKGKNHEALNWALWPTLDSVEKIRTYSLLYNMAHDFRFADPWRLDEE